MKIHVSMLVIALAATSLVADAHAEDPRKAQADALFEEGVKLHYQDREAEALEKFKKAYALYALPNTLMGQARAEQLLGRPLEAIRHYREALKSPLLHPKNVELATGYIAELEKRLGRVSVTGPSGTKFSIYGETFRLPLEAPLDVDPGRLVLHGDHDGKVLEGSVEANAGKLVVLDLKPKEGLVAPPPEVFTPPPREPEVSWWSAGKTAGVVLGAASLAAIGGFVGFRLAASAKGKEVDDASKDPAAANGCVGASAPACDRVNDGAASERDLTNVSTGFLISGLGLAAVAAGAFFLWPSAPSKSASGRVTVLPQIGERAGTIMLRGSF